MWHPENRVERAIGVVALVGTMLLSGAITATAAGTLDQQQTSSSVSLQVLNVESIAQTFTAGITGSLDQADLLLGKTGNPPPTVTVEIRTTSGGVPTATVLATGTISSADLPTAPATQFTPVTFATPAPVTAGTTYALVVYSAAESPDAIDARVSSANPYAPGDVYYSNQSPPDAAWNHLPGWDLAFKTYVTAPAEVAPPPVATTTCAGLDATRVGTPGNDVILGTEANDVIAGLGGDDVIKSDGGNDIICGGDGDDKLKGGSGNDRIYGDRGADRLKGGTGTDTCRGGRGDDSTSSCERP